LSQTKPEYSISESVGGEEKLNTSESSNTTIELRQTTSQINPQWSIFVSILVFIGIFFWQFLAATELHTNDISLLFVYPSIWGLLVASLVGIVLYKIFKHRIVEIRR
jgi:lipid-A-disaccharide synthase-like uncharacterized protein